LSGAAQLQMNKLVGIAGVGMAVAVVAGCATTRDAYEKEYARLSSMPPATLVVSPNREVANCAKSSCDLFNEVQPLMKAYVAKTESSHEFTGFMNDVLV